MAFSLIYPQHDATIQNTAIVHGQLGSNVLSVTGRMISYSPSTTIYAVRMDQLPPKFWRLVFTDLKVDDIYDLEVLDQRGRVVATANGLRVAPAPASATIDYPKGGTVCPNLMAVGTTTRPVTDPLAWMKVKKGVKEFTGVEDLRIGNVWSVIFERITEDTGYTLEIGHDEAGADSADIDVKMFACNPIPDPGPIPGPIPGPGPGPGPIPDPNAG